MNEWGDTLTVGIERGIIRETDGGLYKVESVTRPGVVSRFIEGVNQYVNEREGAAEEIYENKYRYSAGDEVYFFLFADGRGMVLGKVLR